MDNRQFEGTLTALGGLCAMPADLRRNPLGEWDPLYVPPRFGPLRGWRSWFQRGDAGEPLLGHVTPPVVRVRVMDWLPAIGAPRGGITFR